MELRATFDAVAESYDKARPRFPDALFDGLPGGLGTRVLEIGCGTGQATEPLARRGYQVVCVELGPALAQLGRRRLAPFPGVTVHTGSFEEWPVEPGSFDVVLAATSWHWLEPGLAFAKAATALRPGGLLALCSHVHVSDGCGDEFYEATRPIYARCSPELAARYRPLPDAADVQPASIDEAWFEPAGFEAIPMVTTYTAAGYLDLLRTFSPHLAAPAEQTDCLFAGLAELIDGRFGGTVTKHLLATLTLARKRPR